MLLEVNGYTFEVELENNTSAKALKEYVSKEKHFLQMIMETLKKKEIQE